MQRLIHRAPSCTSTTSRLPAIRLRWLGPPAGLRPLGGAQARTDFDYDPPRRGGGHRHRAGRQSTRGGWASSCGSAERVLTLMEELGFDLFANELLHVDSGRARRAQGPGGVPRTSRRATHHHTAPEIGRGFEVHEMHAGPSSIRSVNWKSVTSRIRDAQSSNFLQSGAH